MAAQIDQEPTLDGYLFRIHLVLDPFAGASTTRALAVGLGRRSLGIELNPEYAAFARQVIEAVRMKT